MSATLSAKHIKEVSKSIRSQLDRPGFVPFKYPLMPVVRFVPPKVPYSHPVRDFYDDRGHTNCAPKGYWDVEVWHLVNDHAPVAMAAFVLLDDGRVIADRLSVEADFRGQGLGKRLIDLGKRLWGSHVEGSEHFRDADEGFWNSEPIESVA